MLPTTLALTLPHRLRRDVAANMRALETDLVHGGVGGGLGGGKAHWLEKLCRIFARLVITWVKMQPKADAQLLRDYAERGADAAFTELVHRHANLVYSAALRQVESPDTAAEITQGVFIGLARGAQALAPRLAAEASLAGWLCRSARNLSLNHRRDEFRRLTRERHAMEQLISIPDDAPNWEHLRGVLDDAMAELTEADYDALVLRFFQNQDFRTVGAAIGVSDDTAQKRVARALEKLRELLSQHGIRTSAAALPVVISANAVQAAPVGLAVTISAAALAGTAATASTLIAATTKTIAMTTLQKTLVTATVAVLAGAGIYEALEASALRNEVQTLQQQQAPLAEQNRQLQSEWEEMTNRLASLAIENEQLMKNANELLRLRGQITELRSREKELRRLNEQRLAAKNVSATNALNFDQPYLTKATCGNVGLDTVEHALQTYLWALNTGDEKILADISTKDDKGNAKKLEGLSLDFEQKLVGVQPLSATVGAMVEGVSQPRSDKDVIGICFMLLAEVTSETDGGYKLSHMPLTLHFKREAAQWKFDGRIR